MKAPIFGICSESPRTKMFNMYHNGIKRMLRDGCVGIPNLSPIFLITPVKYDIQQILILKVTSENVVKVKKLW